MKLSKIYVLSSSISGSSANGDVTGTGEISDAIKRVSGVGDVKNFTAQDYSMRVWLQPKQDRCAGHYA
jgi:multidrug efflux pump subunit AcrB